MSKTVIFKCLTISLLIVNAIITPSAGKAQNNGAYSIKNIYNLLISDPEMRQMAQNNCNIWRARNRNGISFYGDTRGSDGIMVQGVAPTKALAIDAAVKIWTRKYCPDIF